MGNPGGIKGYRKLTEQEIRSVNASKLLEEQIQNFINLQGDNPEVDKRALALAATNIQQGFMWLTRALTRKE